jgi:hypothetical protein
MQGFGFFRSHIEPLLEDTPGESGDDSKKPEAAKGDAAKDDEGDDDDSTVSMKQKDLDKLISKRLAKAEKQWQKDLEDRKQKEGLSETEKLKAEMADKEGKLKSREDAATAKLIRADLKAEAAAQGVSKESLEYFLKIIDTSDIELDDAGDPDPAAVTKAVAAALKAVPAFKGQTQKDLGGGSNPGNPPTVDEVTQVQKELEDAKKNGRIVEAVRLERKLHELSRKK